VEAYIKRFKGAEADDTIYNLDSWKLSGFGKHRHPSHLSSSLFFFIFFPSYHQLDYWIKNWLFRKL